jgi:predicted nucleic acid-binding protein
MRTALADTSFFIAFLNQRDRHHARALDLMANFPGRIVATEWVLAELGNYLSVRSNRALFVPFVRDMPADARMEVVPAERRQFEAGCALYAARPDKEWSITDCTSMNLMGERGLTEVITCDHHFEQAGYSILLK